MNQTRRAEESNNWRKFNEITCKEDVWCTMCVCVTGMCMWQGSSLCTCSLQYVCECGCACRCYGRARPISGPDRFLACRMFSSQGPHSMLHYPSSRRLKADSTRRNDGLSFIFSLWSLSGLNKTSINKAMLQISAL